MFAEIAVGIFILIITILMHGAGMRAITRQFGTLLDRSKPQPARLREDLMLGAAVGALAVLHLLETLVWTLPIYLGGLIPDPGDSYYFVMQSYTTLGDSNISLPAQWRLLEPIIAMSGMLTFGWTAAVLVSLMTEYARHEMLRSVGPHSGTQKGSGE